MKHLTLNTILPDPRFTNQLSQSIRATYQSINMHSSHSRYNITWSNFINKNTHHIY